MRAVAEHAGKVGVMLGLEPLNRFEVYFLNAHADAAKFCREVNHPNCRMMYDTFHSNIEEKSIPAAFHAIKDMLCHIHISENDRSTPGHGNVRWKENFDAIRDIGYDGWLVIEAFGLALPNWLPPPHLATHVRQRIEAGRARFDVHEAASRNAAGILTIKRCFTRKRRCNPFGVQSLQAPILGDLRPVD